MATKIVFAGKKFSKLPEATQALKEDFLRCSSAEEAPLIVFVSKMFSVEKSQLPENRPKPLTPEEMAARREQARKRHAERMAAKEHTVAADAGVQLTEEQMAKLTVSNGKEEEDSREGEMAFVAFARVFSGVLKPGREVRKEHYLQFCFCKH